MEKTNDLEHQYACSRWTNRTGTPDDIVASHCSFAESRSKEARERLKYTRISYGPTSEQATDWFESPAHSSPRPVFVFIHGGYWQEMSLDTSAYMAECLVKKGFTVVSVGYDLCPTVSLQQLVQQVEDAIRLVLQRTAKECSLYICGHSAGGHLTAYMMSVFAQETRIRGYFVISGVLDLEPLIYTSINDKIGMDLSTAKGLSPQHIDWPRIAVKTCVLLAYGQLESPAFKTQTQKFAQRLKFIENIECHVHEIADVDHFQIVESLNDPNSYLTNLLMNLIAL